MTTTETLLFVVAGVLILHGRYKPGEWPQWISATWLGGLMIFVLLTALMNMLLAEGYQ